MVVGITVGMVAGMVVGMARGRKHWLDEGSRGRWKLLAVLQAVVAVAVVAVRAGGIPMRLKRGGGSGSDSGSRCGSSTRHARRRLGVAVVEQLREDRPPCAMLPLLTAWNLASWRLPMLALPFPS
jgi:hypothetical protein